MTREKMFDHEDFSAQRALLRDKETERIWETYDEILEKYDDEKVDKIKSEGKSKEIELFHCFLKKAGIGTSSQEAVRLAKMYDL